MQYSFYCYQENWSLIIYNTVSLPTENNLKENDIYIYKESKEKAQETISCCKSFLMRWTWERILIKSERCIYFRNLFMIKQKNPFRKSLEFYLAVKYNIVSYISNNAFYPKLQLTKNPISWVSWTYLGKIIISFVVIKKTIL